MPRNPTYKELKQRIKSLEKADADRKRADVSIRKEERQFRDIFDNSIDGILIFNTDGVIVLANPAALQLYGYAGNEMIGLHGKDIVHPDYYHLFEDFRKQLQSTGKFSAESVDLRKDGTTFNIEVRGSSFLYMKEPHLLAIVRDVTNQKIAEKALTEGNKTLNDILEKAADGICVCLNTPEEPYVRFTHWNPRMVEITGYTIEEINRLGWYQTMYPDPVVQEKAVERMDRMRDGDNIISEEWIITDKKGREKPLIISTSVLKTEEDKTHVLAVMHDITEHKRAEEELKASKAQLSNALEMAHLGHWEYDVATDLFTFNDQFYNIFRTTVEKIGGYTMHSAEYAHRFVHPDDMDVVGEETRKAIETTDPHFSRQIEHRMLYADGTIGCITVRFFIVKDSHGRTVKTYGVNQDITERKNLESQLRQSQKMEAIGTLAGGVAHEFNNILGIIVGNSDLALIDLPEGNPARSYLDEIQSASFRARDIVKHILSFARKAPFQAKPIEIAPVVKEVVKLMRATIPMNIEIEQNISCESEIVSADPTEIHQVVMNLVTNAAHALRTSDGILTVGLEPVTLDKDAILSYEGIRPGNFVRLIVKDTGHGIAPELIGRIFEPFFTTKEVGEGTGMGLAVVYGIVKKYEGAIKVTSEPGKGSAFEVLLPQAEKTMVLKADRVEELPTGTERILFVDDEVSIVNLAKLMLERQGYKVNAASNSLEVLERFKADPGAFDLVISDMAMPHMTGDLLAQELIKIRPDIPIILCTGHSDRMDGNRAKAIGVKAFVFKPLVMKDMAKTVRKVLDGARG